MARQHDTSTERGRDAARSHGSPDRTLLLHLLGEAYGEPLTIADLREFGVGRPGEAIYELQLDGYPVRRLQRSSPARGRTVTGWCLARPPRASGAPR